MNFRVELWFLILYLYSTFTYLIVEMEQTDVISICYHFPSLDTLFGLAYLKLYFNQQPQFTYNYHQINNRLSIDSVQIQYSEKLYFVGIVPKIHILVQNARMANQVIIIDNKTDNAIELSSKIRDPRLKSKVKFVYPANSPPAESVSSVCHHYLPPTTPIPQSLSHIAAYVSDAELFKFELPRSKEVASGLYAL